MFSRRTTAGLDVGGHALKYAALETDSRRVRVLWQAELMPERTAQSDLLDGEARRERAAALAAELVRLHPGAPRSVTTAVQGADTFCQYLELPLVSARELEVAVPSAARKLIPFPMESAVLSWVSVPPVDPAAKKSAVFLVAAPRAAVDRQRAFVAGLGFEVRRMDVMPLALVRAYAVNRGAATGGAAGKGDGPFVALLHVGYEATTLVAVREGYPYYVREFTPAGRQFTYGFQMGDQSTWAAAESVKLKYDVMDRDVSIEPFVLRWLSDVSRTLQHFEQQFSLPSPGVQQLVLSGGTASWKGLDRRLSEHLERPVEVERWQRVKVPDAFAGAAAAAFEVAVGLALED